MRAGVVGLASVLAFWLLTVPAMAQIDEPEWLRVSHVTDETPATLDVAIGRYARPDGLQVDLVGVVHVAEPEYFQTLNRRLAEYDRVLFELVGRPETLNGGAPRGTSMIGLLQGGMTEALGLAFQLDEIDYSPPHFVHADLDRDEFVASMDERGESIFQFMLRAWALGVAEQAGPAGARANADLLGLLTADDFELALKRTLATELAGRVDQVAALAGRDGSTLIEGRNVRAIEVLTREIAAGHRRIAIFYGAGHMPDFAERLERQFGLRWIASEWIPAWNLADTD